MCPHHYHLQKRTMWSRGLAIGHHDDTGIGFVAVLYVALCVGATIAYVIATLLVNASKR